MKIMVIEENWVLKDTKEEDLDRIREIEGKEENLAYVYNWSKKQHLATIENPDQKHLSLWDPKEQRIMGYMILAGMESPHEALELMRITIDEKGQGYGKEAILWVINFCFDTLGYHRLWLDVFTDNHRAISIYRQMGFTQEGILRDCKKYGDSYRSMMLFSMLEEEYKEHAYS